MWGRGPIQTRLSVLIDIMCIIGVTMSGGTHGAFAPFHAQNTPFAVTIAAELEW